MVSCPPLATLVTPPPFISPPVHVLAPRNCVVPLPLINPPLTANPLPSSRVAPLPADNVPELLPPAENRRVPAFAFTVPLFVNVVWMSVFAPLPVPFDFVNVPELEKL